MADWAALKAEYATTQISYRKLAKLRGVPYRTLAQRARAENWVEARNQYCDKSVTKAINQASSESARRAIRIQTVADKLLDKVERLIEAETEVDANPRAMRDVAMVLKELKDIQNIRSDIDLREQEARIRKLQKDAEDKSGENEKIEIVLSDGLDEFAN